MGDLTRPGEVEVRSRPNTTTTTTTIKVASSSTLTRPSSPSSFVGSFLVSHRLACGSLTPVNQALFD
jgi:hypothetical protein